MRGAIACFSLVILANSAALAAPVSPTAANQVAAISYDGYGIRLLRVNGEVWSYAVADYGWRHEDGTQGTTNMTLPMPVSEVADWSYYFLFTQAGVLWQFDPNGTVGWHVVAFPPAEWGATPIQQKSLGDAKRRYR